MKKLSWALLLLLGSVLHAYWCPPLTEEERCVLKEYEDKGRFAFIWYDQQGHTHISAVNGGVDIRSASPGMYHGKTKSGERILLCKDVCDCLYLNGAPVEIRHVDWNSWHVYLVPVCD